MLRFLNENPGSTSAEVKAHLHGDTTVAQVRVRYAYKNWNSEANQIREQWQSKRYVFDHMLDSDWYQDIEILGERDQLLSKICRGKFSYLLSPYYSRTLGDSYEGRNSHPRCTFGNSGNRRWWYRVKWIDGLYHYFLTVNGMAAIQMHGLP